ncbi:MAG: hypothetical protein AB1756_00195 [Acidobacteriota bacterium]
MENFLARQGLLLRDFKGFIAKHSTCLKHYTQDIAAKAKRPYRYLTRTIRKEELARKIACEDGITSGLICVFAILEGCQSFKLVYGEGRPTIVNAPRKCLRLYFYFIDPVFGFTHIRLQTWFPFTLQVCLNGHDWLARQMDTRGIAYQNVANAFIQIDDPGRAQRLADRFPNLPWPRILSSFARKANPLMKTLLSGMEYYWVVDQSEYATDVMFTSRKMLQPLYENLLKHATLCFSAEDIMTFLGRKLHSGFAGEIINTFAKRWPGARIKHRMKENWIKMYDKIGCVLRVETVINHPYEFMVRRRGIWKGECVVGWFPMRKGVANFYRYAEVSRAANARYLDALAVVDDPAIAYRQLNLLVEPVRCNDRPYLGFNPASDADIRLFSAVMRGEHMIRGCRNKNIRFHLFSPARGVCENRRQSAAVSRLFKRLHLRGLIAKFPDPAVGVSPPAARQSCLWCSSFTMNSTRKPA